MLFKFDYSDGFGDLQRGELTCPSREAAERILSREYQWFMITSATLAH